ncbi:MAG: serine hydrolase [Polyangiaceae bacterium]|nr:serine hydrolase [Polyangiaceae bacterium]
MTPEHFMQRFIYPCAFSLLHACGPEALSASRDPATATQARLVQMLNDELPGVQYVVVNQRGPVFDAALGVRDAKTTEAMRHATLQMAYSMTKAITAIAVMQLVDDHRIGLDDSLAKYVAHPYGNAVTIRHLLAQTSGVPNPLPLDWFEVEGSSFARDEKLREALRKNAQLKHAPGTEYSYSSKVLKQLKTWLWSQAVLKTLSIGKAAAYAIANWERLTRFVADPRIPLDNNGTERGIRGPVVGRRNHFGSKSERGTEVAATSYTLIETAKLHGINPAKYLLEAARAADRGKS